MTTEKKRTKPPGAKERDKHRRNAESVARNVHLGKLVFSTPFESVVHPKTPRFGVAVLDKNPGKNEKAKPSQVILGNGSISQLFYETLLPIREIDASEWQQAQNILNKNIGKKSRQIVLTSLRTFVASQFFAELLPTSTELKGHVEELIAHCETFLSGCSITDMIAISPVRSAAMSAHQNRICETIAKMITGAPDSPFSAHRATASYLHTSNPNASVLIKKMEIAIDPILERLYVALTLLDSETSKRGRKSEVPLQRFLRDISTIAHKAGVAMTLPSREIRNRDSEETTTALFQFGKYMTKLAYQCAFDTIERNPELTFSTATKQRWAKDVRREDGAFLEHFYRARTLAKQALANKKSAKK
jgi:hypothetical protein